MFGELQKNALGIDLNARTLRLSETASKTSMGMPEGL
jgi:hypothetical protein